MKRSLLVFVVGVLGAIIAHIAWFELRRPAGYNPADGELAWLKTELHLSDQQFAQVKALHEANNPHLLQLASQVSKMRAELQSFEEERRSKGTIDFLEFARFVESRRMIDKQCIDSTRNLVKATADIMTPQQRELYMGLIGPALNTPASQVF